MRSLLILLASLMLVGCDSFRTINVEVTSEATISGGGPLLSSLNGLGFGEFASFDISNSVEFENNDATRNNIGDSYVTEFTLKVVDPDGQTLDFIDTMQVFIGDGDIETEVAYLDGDENTDVTELSLTIVEGAEIGQYLRSDKTKVTVKASGQPPENDTTIEATMGFRIRLVF
ncbi:MAG: hypothetical protein LAT65_14850 [Saccharospirillum sp.]|nr:hypothetical protein [Saccharospirillum sp.]